MTDNDTSPIKLGNKPGRKPNTDKVAELQKRVDRLEEVIAKIAHFSGTQRIILEFGLESFVPGRQDMKKYKD